MNKGQIRAHFKALLNRSDCPDGLADIFIDQATTRIQRVLRTPAQEAQQTYTISSQTGSISIPNNLLEIMQVYMGWSCSYKNTSSRDDTGPENRRTRYA